MKSFKKNRPFFLVRLDDIHPRMNHDNFDRLINLLSKYTIQGILGVIPDNQDQKLMIQNEDLNFWHQMKLLEDRGYWIAQHGYQHIYDSNDGGILNLNKQSEFAGHSYDVQKRKLEKGKTILESKGLNPKVFMAPSHSYDHTTVKVIKQLGYAITDGFGLFPKKKEGVLYIPQLFASPKHIGVGLYTICLHTDQMKENDFNRLENHIKKHKLNYISPNQIETYQIKENKFLWIFIDSFFGILFKYITRIKRNVIK